MQIAYTQSRLLSAHNTYRTVSPARRPYEKKIECVWSLRYKEKIYHERNCSLNKESEENIELNVTLMILLNALLKTKMKITLIL